MTWLRGWLDRREEGVIVLVGHGQFFKRLLKRPDTQPKGDRTFEHRRRRGLPFGRPWRQAHDLGVQLLPRPAEMALSEAATVPCAAGALGSS